jgi:hypothetical protein
MIDTGELGDNWLANELEAVARTAEQNPPPVTELVEYMSDALVKNLGPILDEIAAEHGMTREGAAKACVRAWGMYSIVLVYFADEFDSSEARKINRLTTSIMRRAFLRALGEIGD